MDVARSTDGTHIAYFVTGYGPPLLLHHGFGDSSQGWIESGYIEALQDEYQLILIDARGHGASDKPHDPVAYAMEQRVADVVAVLDALDIEQVHFMGYSMGGWIGFRVGVYAPERVASLLLGGSHPFAPPDEPDPALAALSQGIEQFLELWEQMSGRLPEVERERILANDPDALIAARLAYRRERALDRELAYIAVPTLVYAGDQDEPAHSLGRRAAAQMPDAQFVSLPGCNHLEAFERIDLILPYVRAFLGDVG